MSKGHIPEDQASKEGTNHVPGLLWDWPTRVFHWVLAGAFAAAFIIAHSASKQSALFYIHMIFGAIMVPAVLLRIVWGFIGSHTSRFHSFLFSPKALFLYVKSAIRGEDRPSPGHNPGSSYAIYIMLLAPLGLAATGWAQWQGLLDTEELHEMLAFLMIAAVTLHLAGLSWHTIRHRENIAMSMVHGKRAIPREKAIVNAYPWVGVAFLLILAVGTALIISWGNFY